MGAHGSSHLFGLRATASEDTYRTHVDCVRDGGVLLVGPHCAMPLRVDFRFMLWRSIHSLPLVTVLFLNSHSYSPATAAHRSALDSGRSSGSRHSAITCIATLNLCLFRRPESQVRRHASGRMESWLTQTVRFRGNGSACWVHCRAECAGSANWPWIRKF